MERKVMGWRMLATIVAVFLLLFGVAMVSILSTRQADEAKYAQQQAQIVSLEKGLSSLKNDLARVGSDGYVENEARVKYDYIKNGEYRFEFSDPKRLEYYTEEELQVILDEQLY